MKRVLSVCAIGLFMVGCDASKAELESTKSTLTSVSRERDELRTRLVAAQAQLDAAKADLAKAKAAPTPAVAAAPDAKKPAAPAPQKKHKS